jgi:hypothetical protein
MTTAEKRPRPANQSLSSDRGVKAQKIIYGTEAKLQKLLLRLIKKTARNGSLRASGRFKSWPVRTT